MRITQIEIQNYGPIEHANIAVPGKSLALFGYNGNAKSMVISAIQYALFGFNEYTDKRGSGIKELIRDGSTASDIHVTFTTDKWPTPITIHASITPKKAEWFCCDDASGELIEGIESRDDFWHYCGISKDHAALCAFPVETVTSTAITDVLTGLLGDCITPESVGAAAGEYREWLGHLLKKRHIKIDGAGALEQIGKVCYDERALLNKNMKDINAEWESAPYRLATQPVKPDGTAFVAEDMPNIETQLNRLRGERDEVLREIGAAGAAVALEDDHDERLAELEEAVTTADKECGKHEKAVEKTSKAYAEADTQAEVARKKHSDGSTLSRSNHERLKQLEKTVASVNLDGVCPTCNRKYDKKTNQIITDALTKDVDAQRVIVDDLLAADKENMAALVASREKLSTARAALDGAKGALDIANRKHAEAVNALAIQRAKRPFDAAKLAELEATKTALEARIATGETKLAELKQWIQRGEMERCIAANQAQLAPLEWAVRSFYHGEITNQLISKELSRFAGVVNGTLSRFGYKIEYVVEKKNITPMLLTPGSKQMRPIGLCSRGQRLLAAWSVAVAFAGTGAPVLLDDINDLDALNRRDLLKSLADVSAGSVVVAGAWQQNQALPEMESALKFVESLGDVTVAWVDGGEIITINEGVAA